MKKNFVLVLALCLLMPLVAAAEGNAVYNFRMCTIEAPAGWEWMDSNASCMGLKDSASTSFLIVSEGSFFELAEQSVEEILSSSTMGQDTQMVERGEIDGYPYQRNTTTISGLPFAEFVVFDNNIGLIMIDYFTMTGPSADEILATLHLTQQGDLRVMDGFTLNIPKDWVVNWFDDLTVTRFISPSRYMAVLAVVRDLDAVPADPAATMDKILRDWLPQIGLTNILKDTGMITLNGYTARIVNTTEENGHPLSTMVIYDGSTRVRLVTVSDSQSETDPMTILNTFRFVD